MNTATRMSFQTQKKERPDPNEMDLASGTVTRVAQQKKDLDRVSVFIDDEFAFGIALDLAIEVGLKKGIELSADKQRELLVRQETFDAKASALRSLEARARTSQEVFRSLRMKGFSEDVIEDTVHALERAGMLDDEAYAQAFASQRFASSGYGPARIRQDLQKRGIERGLIDAAISELEESEDLAGRADADARKRWNALASEEDPRKRRKKTFDYLVRRGFSFDDARQAVEAAEAHED